MTVTLFGQTFEVTRRGAIENPYRGEEGGLLQTYGDDAKRMEIWCKEELTGTGEEGTKVVQVSPDVLPGASSRTMTVERMPVRELREAAHAILGTVGVGSERRSSLHPLEDNRRGQIYYFRWDDFTKPLKSSEMPPFVQVALRPDGSLAAFTNTL